jgi:hypothetical protein
MALREPVASAAGSCSVAATLAKMVCKKSKGASIALDVA